MKDAQAHHKEALGNSESIKRFFLCIGSNDLSGVYNGLANPSNPSIKKREQSQEPTIVRVAGLALSTHKRSKNQKLNF
jgi:hypothetical protein